MMNVPQIMAIRMGVYLVLIGYLICDLFLFRGPIWEILNVSGQDREKIVAEAKADGVVAIVYGRPIYRTQVDQSVVEWLWRRGRTIDQTSPQERRLIRNIAVRNLIDDELLKMQIKVAPVEEVDVSDDRVAAAVEVENNRLAGADVEGFFDKAIWQGSKEHEMRVAARIQRTDYLDRVFQDQVDQGLVDEWLEENRGAFVNGVEPNREAISNALAIKKREARWKIFRNGILRPKAGKSLHLFEDILHAE